MISQHDIEVSSNVTPRDVSLVAANMREADRVEVLAWADVTPTQAIHRSLEGSETSFAVRVDGEPVLVFGFCPQGSILRRTAAPWLLGTPAIKQISFAFLRGSRDVVDAALRKYGRLENWVDSENTVSRRWLYWLGFQVEEHQFISRGGRHFEYFWKQQR